MNLQATYSIIANDNMSHSFSWSRVVIIFISRSFLIIIHNCPYKMVDTFSIATITLGAKVTLDVGRDVDPNQVVGGDEKTVICRMPFGHK